MKEQYFFDNAATSWPKPEAVYVAMDRCGRELAVNPGRSGYALAIEAGMMVQQTRSLLAEFFGFSGGASRVVFSANATASMNQLIQGVLRSGDHMITSVSEHNSVIRPMNHLARDQGTTCTLVGVDDDGYINVDDVANAIQPNTRLLMINHASNVTGSVQDITALGQLARQHNVIFAIDTAQTAGVLPINMAADQIDVLVFTGHKGLFGPMGTGGMLIGGNVDIEPIAFGGTGVDSVDPFQPTDYPHRLEAGTVNVPGIAGLNAAQHWFRELGQSLTEADAHSIGHDTGCSVGCQNGEVLPDFLQALQHIHATEMRHRDRIVSGLSTINQIKVLANSNTSKPRVATLAFTVPGMSSTRIGEQLDADHHVCVRTGLHCAPLIHGAFDTHATEGAVRVAPGYFTTDDDVDHLLAAIADVVG